ncbi:hypothetical protein C8J45_101614 [Sphingomonas sp. PP-CE-3G-477]|uniref:hypothetical protein n=1 Tax=unclassified Sphingomonas TaxID=196159 RepID=UPI000D4B1148|nr:MULTISPECIES: hypothetical protein [unclassified Sphingomonas]MBD8618068.1 hypothetical protein [Sphingomonas sp. CFBP 13728]MBE2990797.1 hypothetical protein [Sphingomonas sp. CFBP 13603]PTQ65761.1 hypothetical protein C8J45_101614 [Sphingomonas sp. PP-CE-3G-477]
MRKLILSLSAIAVAAMPVAASAASNSAASLSTTKSVRAASSTGKKSHFADVSGSGLLIIAIAAVAVGGGLYMAIDNDDNSDSN